MKYTTKVTTPQLVGTFKVNPRGGEITKNEFRAFLRDPYGADLVKKGWFTVPEAAGITEKVDVKKGAYTPVEQVPAGTTPVGSPTGSEVKIDKK
jgi:hypothetical protein